MSEKDGGPAISAYFDAESLPIKRPDMDLRDWFAGKALDRSIEIGMHALQKNLITKADYPERVANWAYEIADAMLKERSK